MEMRAGTAVVRKLWEGGEIELEGVRFIRDGDGRVQPGDTYIGARNTVQLLTCKAIDGKGFVLSEEPAYPFDLGECVKVKLVE